MIDDEDKDVEALLRRYPPAVASAALRERVMRSAINGPRAGTAVWWQLAAAAVLIVIGTGFQVATARIDRTLAARPANDQTRDRTSAGEIDLTVQEAVIVEVPSQRELFVWPEEAVPQ